MSHAAIVSREYGLPAVVGTGTATSRIKTGQRLRVDGTDGRVTILDEACAMHGAARRPARRRRGAVRRQEREPRRADRGRDPGAARVRGEHRRRRRGDRRRLRGARRARSPCARARSARTAPRRPSPACRRRSCGCRGDDARPRRGARLLGEPRQPGGDRLPRADGRGTPAMGVTVQLMVDADVSGVMFTCNPVSGDPSTVAMNASWGLGLAVVGGEVTPDEYRVSKVTGEVLHRTVGPKHIEYAARRRARGRAGRAAGGGVPRRAALGGWSSWPGAWSATSAPTRTSSGRSPRGRAVRAPVAAGDGPRARSGRRASRRWTRDGHVRRGGS